jgi:hypothetical protein
MKVSALAAELASFGVVQKLLQLVYARPDAMDLALCQLAQFGGDVPTWGLVAAERRWARGDVDKDSDPHWRPACRTA